MTYLLLRMLIFKLIAAKLLQTTSYSPIYHCDTVFLFVYAGQENPGACNGTIQQMTDLLTNNIFVQVQHELRRTCPAIQSIPLYIAVSL